MSMVSSRLCPFCFPCFEQGSCQLAAVLLPLLELRRGPRLPAHAHDAATGALPRLHEGLVMPA
ncbi:hypothetical protein, partial [Desulfovibrio sp.]|uniref:hypothetical protein n=1 Tax=Desulfovibrio sp. TaxID=885 RepID=UPI003FD6DB60